jgi:hypothetical protein
MTNASADAALTRCASRFAGAFSHRDARMAGLSQRQIDLRLHSGLWIAEFPRVYRHGSTPVTADLRRHAALLWAGADAVLSHRSAAAVSEFDGVDDGLVPELTVPGRRLAADGVVVHRSPLPRRDWSYRGELKLTRPSRVIVELAQVMDEKALECALEAARRRRLVTISSVANQLDAMGRKGRPGAGTGRASRAP